MKTTIADRPTTTQPRLVIEVVGPAGSGKTTLAKAMSRRDQRIVTDIQVSKAGFVPFFIQNTRLFLPTYLRSYRQSRWFTWKETRSMVYLKAWQRLMRQGSSGHAGLTLFDHGPIFRLVRLHAFGPEITRSRLYEQWWISTLKQWAATLNVVIWLEAPYEILAQRIDARDEWHRVKGKAQHEMHEFLERYDASYERALSMLTAHGGPRVLRFDTQRESADQIAEEALSALEAELHMMEFQLI